MPDEIKTTTEQTPSIETRKDAIASAVESVSQEEEGTQQVSQEEDKKPTEKTEVKEEEDKLETAEAIKLYQALKNPETAKIVIHALADKAGILKPTEKLETKQDVQEAKEDLQSLLRESLGDEFSFLADKFAPAIEKYLDKKRKEDLADIRANLEQQEREKLEAQSARVFTKLSNDFFGEDAEIPNEVSKEISKFMEKVPPSPDLDLKEYIELAFNSAIGKLGLSKVDKKKQERISSNRSDAASRLASDRSGTRTAQAVPDTSKPMTRKEAIAAALESVKAD